MNEIKKIHLGRQPFTIAIDAHKALQVYLEAIAHQVGSKSEVIKEVESRMAELLLERGITGDKVVLSEDVDFLKEQLGDPGDFKDDDHDHEPEQTDTAEGQRRLFRDPQHAMVAGVCSGIAAYFGIDVTIVRLVFVVALFFGGAAIPVYLVLWLVMPEAKTPSERLQMQGKAVTVDSLKELVDRADVKGAAGRATKTVGPVFERVMKACSAVIGASLIVIAATLFAAMATAVTYLLFHRRHLIAETVPFPMGRTETTFVAMCAVVGFIVSLLTLLIGVAMVRRKWLVPGWVTAAFVGIMLIAGAVGTAVTPDALDHAHNRYIAAQQVSVERAHQFSKVLISDAHMDIVYEKSDTYEVGIRYVGKEKPVDLKYTIQDDQLILNDDSVQWRDCHGWCLSPGSFDEVVVRAPKLEVVRASDGRVWHDVQDGERIDTGDYRDYSGE